MDRIFDKYYDKIYYWSLKKTHNKEDAEDLTNNVFVSIFEYFNKNINVEKMENLIWKIAYNIWSAKAKIYIKEKHNISYDGTYDIGYEENTLDKIIYKEIVNNLDNINLTDKENKSFRMYYIDNFSIKEISEELETSENNIKYYLYNARKKIKEEFNYE